METEAQIFCLISFVFIKSKPFSWAVCPHKVLCFNTASILPNKAERRFIPWCQRHRTGALPTLAAGALAAVNDRQNDGLDVSAGAPQAEEAHGVLRIQPVAAAVTERLQIRLLRERERRTRYQRPEQTGKEPNPRITIQIVFTLHLLKCQWPALFDGAEWWDHLERRELCSLSLWAH